MAELAAKGDVFVPQRDRIGQSPGEVDPAGQHIRQGVAALFPALHKQHHCVDAGDFIQKAKVDQPAHVDDEHGVGVSFGHRAQVLPLDVGQAVVAGFQPAVIALAGLTGQRIQGGVGIAVGDVLCRDGPAAGVAVDIAVGQRDDLHWVGQAGDLAFHHIVVFGIGTGMLGIVIVQPAGCGDRIPGVLQPLFDGHAVPFLHAAAAKAALDGLAGPHAVQRDVAGLERQCAALVFQKHKALGGGPAGQGAVGKFQRGGGGAGGSV